MIIIETYIDMSNVKPYLLHTMSGKQLAVFLKHPQGVIKDDSRCRTCRYRNKMLQSLSGPDGPIISSYNPCDKPNGLLIVKNKFVYDLTPTKGITSDGTPFYHLYVSIPDDMQTTVSHDDIDMIEYTLYHNITKIIRIIRTLIRYGHDTLSKINDVCSKIPYCIKWKPTIIWLHSLLDAASKWNTMSSAEKYIFSAQQLLKCENDTILSNAFKYIIPIMIHAPTNTIIKHFCFQIYWMQPNDYKFNIFDFHRAGNILGDFSISVMPLSNLQTYAPETIFHAGNESNVLIKYRNQYMSKSMKRYYPCSKFPIHVHMMTYAKIDRIRQLKTIKDFVEFCQLYPNTHVFIHRRSAENHYYSYMTISTLSSSCTDYRYMWTAEKNFNQSRMLTFDNSAGFMRVIATVPMCKNITKPFQNVLFVLPNPKFNWNRTKNCHPMFLNDSCRSVCAGVFNDLNQTITLNLPNESIVGGFIINRKKYYTPLILFVDGVQVILTHFND